jgi:release factor glutamine methyltransferase
VTTIRESLQLGADRLGAAGVADPKREAGSLLALALGRDRTFLIAHPEEAVADGDARRFEAFLTRRESREPFQYIAGKQEFYRLEFEVTPDVLIPRPETEMVVEAAVEFLRAQEKPRFCEVGLGSGCIAVSILHEVPAARAVGLDISPATLAVAARNAERHGVGERLEIRESDVFSALSGAERFALIASNPPYVPARHFAGLQEEVRDFEPRVALTDGGDGLSIVRKIVQAAPSHLESGGLLLLEIGFDQADAVRQMFDLALWADVALRPDLQGIPRLVRAVLK